MIPDVEGFPQLAYFLELPISEILVFGDLFRGPFIYGNYHHITLNPKH